MEYWELFLKGVARSIEDFVRQMIEKGSGEVKVPDAAAKEDEGEPIVEEIPEEESSAPRRVPRKRSIPRRELGELEDKIYEALEKYPDGCTLKDLAKSLDMQWHFLRIPLRQLAMDKKVEKDGKNYKMGFKREAPVVVERNGVRRRFVDAKALETIPEEKPTAEASEMSNREKEILRFKILTAFRGRPEGLTIAELAAVLGRSIEGLSAIVKEMASEKKVAEGKGGKFHLA
jgi:hypothetical protein